MVASKHHRADPYDMVLVSILCDDKIVQHSDLYWASSCNDFKKKHNVRDYCLVEAIEDFDLNWPENLHKKETMPYSKLSDE